MHVLFEIALIAVGGWAAAYTAFLAWVAVSERRRDRRYKLWTSKCKAKYGEGWQPWMGEDGDWLDQQNDEDQRRRKIQGRPYLYDPDESKRGGT